MTDTYSNKPCKLEQKDADHLQNVAGTFKQIDTPLTQRRSRFAPNERVYFIGGGGFIKIGISSDPLDRMAGLQTSSPFELTLLADIPGNRDLEFELHIKFRHLHVRGEWFRNHPDILNFIGKASTRKGKTHKKFPFLRVIEGEQ